MTPDQWTERWEKRTATRIEVYRGRRVKEIAPTVSESFTLGGEPQSPKHITVNICANAAGGATWFKTFALEWEAEPFEIYDLVRVKP
jgi:hypothetical protein